MRCFASSARILTLFTLVVLSSSHSFLLVNAQTNAVDDNAGTSTVGTRSTSSPPQTSTVASTPTATPLPPTTSVDATTTTTKNTSVPGSPTSTSSSDHPSAIPPSSGTQETQQPPTTSQDPPRSSSTSSTVPSSQSGSAPPSSSSSISSTQSSASTTSSQASSSTHATTLEASAATTAAPALVPSSTHVAPLTAGGSGAPPSSYNYLSTGVAGANATPTAGAGASSKSFFDNKGAVAGTFTAVGLIVAGVIGAIVMYYVRKRSHERDEEDAAYFEKYDQDGEDFGSASSPHGASGAANVNNGEPYYGHAKNPSMAQIMTPAASDAYPDRSMHFGYGDTSSASASAGATAGVEYPPGTAYAAAAASQGAYQYQYQYPYSNPAQYGYAYNSNATTDSQERVSPGAHPFANPSNVTKPAGAPPVQVVVTGPSGEGPIRESVYAMDEVVVAGEAQ